MLTAATTCRLTLCGGDTSDMSDLQIGDVELVVNRQVVGACGGHHQLVPGLLARLLPRSGDQPEFCHGCWSRGWFTEAMTWGSRWGWGRRESIGRALLWFEQQLLICLEGKIKKRFFWGGGYQKIIKHFQPSETLLYYGRYSLNVSPGVISHCWAMFTIPGEDYFMASWIFIWLSAFVCLKFNFLN